MTSEGRTKQVPGRLHRRLEPSLRWRKKALVCFYAGATTCVAGGLWGMQKCPGLARACPSTNAS
ncbi:expressed unknown protein [Ectocarpus siliculosus]|uniref:Uncharacterized protein n=1 Tax=Ectocarpus siliculosus TaxID=2880 RepID=D7G3G1_ECTSI|nr:expressed unknown protein [Ectocarpus siliculosus]|eukprot:CBJ26959.1 expressed unknown protein [Ectocarpus siliculosus]